jgi:hypothetical protein
MTTESNSPDTSAIVEVSPETDALVEQEMAGESDEIRRETKALVEAIRKRAQADTQSAEEFTRETYLKAVRQARETIEQNKLFDADQVERSIEMIQKEAEKNWEAIVNEVTEFGDRLSEAAKTAWDIIMQPDDQPKQ